MNTQMLKGKLREKNKTYKDVAEMLNCSVATVSDKLNGKSIFDCAEAVMISDWLNLTPFESVQIFLSKNLHDMQEKIIQKSSN